MAQQPGRKREGKQTQRCLPRALQELFEYRCKNINIYIGEKGFTQTSGGKKWGVNKRGAETEVGIVLMRRNTQDERGGGGERKTCLEMGETKRLAKAWRKSGASAKHSRRKRSRQLTRFLSSACWQKALSVSARGGGGGGAVVGAWQARLQTGHYALWPPAVQGSATLWTPHCTNFLQHGKARSSVQVIETVKEAQRPFWGREFHGTGRWLTAVREFGRAGVSPLLNVAGNSSVCRNIKPFRGEGETWIYVLHYIQG